MRNILMGLILIYCHGVNAHDIKQDPSEFAAMLYGQTGSFELCANNKEGRYGCLSESKENPEALTIFDAVNGHGIEPHFCLDTGDGLGDCTPSVSESVCALEPIQSGPNPEQGIICTCIGWGDCFDMAASGDCDGGWSCNWLGREPLCSCVGAQP